jgi:hypothetical protein
MAPYWVEAIRKLQGEEAGGGLDYNFSKHISIKPIEVECVMTQFDSANLGGSTKGFGDHQNDLRYSAGVVFKFGEK